MSLPYLPLFVSDYDADTGHLSLEEDGLYSRLLRLCWRTPGCSVPNDRAWLERRLRITPEVYDRVAAPVLEEFFVVRGGRLVQPRLLAEHERVSATSKARAHAGKKGGRSKSLKSQESEQSPASHLDLNLNLEPDIRRSSLTLAPSAPAKSSPRPDEAFFVQAAAESYNAVAALCGWPVAQRLHSDRRSKIRQRLVELGGANEHGLQGWAEAMHRASKSRFLRQGREGSTWRPTLDFFLQRKSFTTLMEGGYDDDARGRSAASPRGSARRDSGGSFTSYLARGHGADPE